MYPDTVLGPRLGTGPNSKSTQDSYGESWEGMWRGWRPEMMAGTFYHVGTECHHHSEEQGEMEVV